MIKFFYVKLISSVLIGTLLSSCNSKKESFEIDLSNFKAPSKSQDKINPTDDSESIRTKKEITKNELKSYQNKLEVLSAVKFGKKNPFSEGDDELTKLNSNFQLKGFLKTKLDTYVLVRYSGNEGTLTEDSIGGLNTNLLPEGAKVYNIDPKNKILIIELDKENFTFELQ